jgi:hypothetical protein
LVSFTDHSSCGSQHANAQQVTNLGTPIPLNSIMFSLSILVIIALINIGVSPLPAFDPA